MAHTAVTSRFGQSWPPRQGRRQSKETRSSLAGNQSAETSLVAAISSVPALEGLEICKEDTLSYLINDVLVSSFFILCKVQTSLRVSLAFHELKLEKGKFNFYKSALKLKVVFVRYLPSTFLFVKGMYSVQ